MRYERFEVFLYGKLVDVVFYVIGMSADEVRLSLINHDGYSSGISVVKRGTRG